MNTTCGRYFGLLGTLLTLGAALLSCTGREAGHSQSTITNQHTPSPAATAPAVYTFADAKALGFSYPPAPADWRSAEEASKLSAGCVACHTESDSHTMHASRKTGLSCVDCHGGNANIAVPAELARGSAEFERLKKASHVQARVPELWRNAANPEASGAATLRESADYIRFVNPGDLRAARAACYNCHATEVASVEKSMMAHGGMLWGAALYNNGAINRKDAIFGESYAPDGTPQALVTRPLPTTRQVRDNGVVPVLYPLPRWEVSQPGNILRVFERGGKVRPQLGLPNAAAEVDPGRPDVKLSVRGLGTDVRTDPVFLGLQKTRLLDPTLNTLGTNDHPGDYRASGCSACHVVYANDRSPVHSGVWSKYGNQGRSFSRDPMVNDGIESLKNGATSKPSNDSMAHSSTSGHPIAHSFVRNMPSSTCIVCHVHPGTNVLNSYLGFMWWDNETDGEFMYPKRQKYPTPEQELRVNAHNPEGTAPRGLWSNLYPNDESHAGRMAGEDFLGNLTNLNPHLKQTQFADFHGHGWVFRAVFKQDRKGNLLDAGGNVVADVNAEKLAKAVAKFDPPTPPSEPRTPNPEPSLPVHLKDIHLERGMACVDCHFEPDVHGTGKLIGETRAAVTVECVDCHGSVEEPAAILRYLKLDRRDRVGDQGKALLRQAYTGNAVKTMDEDRLARLGRSVPERFEVRDGRLWQKSSEDGKKGWWVVQTAETVDANSGWAREHRTSNIERRTSNEDGGQRPTTNARRATSSAAELARYAHSVRKDGKTWGTLPAPSDKPELQLAHASGAMSCYSCHSSWNTSCFGCHLPMRANQRKPMLHNEGAQTRNYTNYNYQTLRDDVYMLGIDSTANGHKVVPIRSACAVMVSSQDANRQWIYSQQQTVSAEGFAGTAFSPYFPHTVRSTETKQCTDCHVSGDNDNNAILSQLLLLGTNSVNFVGRFAWVATKGAGLEAVAVTEREEPQAVIGSKLHRLAYPDYFAQHQKRGMELAESHDHAGTVNDVQLRGEYLYAACGKDGFIAYDVANIDNKGFSERIITAPVSPLGQRFYVKTKNATSVCTPSTLAIDPTRPRLPENEEQQIHPLYAFLYVTDSEEGLVVIGNPLSEKKNKPGVATLLDGDPTNNFLSKALSFNPSGVLNGARHMTFAGRYAYVAADAGIVVLDMDNPLAPKVVATVGTPHVNAPRKVQVQFRYAFIADADGLKVLNVTDLASPRPVPGATVAIADARDVYVSRTYAYVAAGKQGLVVVDVEKPERPRTELTYDADGRMSDATAVRVGMTNASMFAYVADGKNGLKVLQLTSDETPGHMGFSPRPAPKLIAWHKTKGPAVSLSEGLDRDRAVDESGNQLAVFGRRGARPFNLAEMQKLYLRPTADGKREVYTVTDAPTTPALEPPAPASAPESAPTTPAPTRRRFPGR